MAEYVAQFGNLPRKIRTFGKLSWGDRLLLVQVLILLGMFRALILTMPFPRLANRFGERMVESPQEVTAEQILQAKKIRWAIRSISPHTPWDSSCFPQALTAKYLLDRRGINSTLYLGARFEAAGKMTAHAWLRCGSLFVTGGAGHLSFGIVSYFS